ncbi:MAG: deoxyribodipyrimidine photo-lyase [Actinomycetota bacterium]|nr:deoxyribodipyrimidine photo-lyase [Actinomycetota bacterium]
MDRSVLWFRRDLRLADHPALASAAAGDRSVVGLFVLDPRLWDTAGDNRRAFLAGCLDELNRAMGGWLVVRTGRPEDVVPAVAAEADADEVWATKDFGPYGQRRDAAVAEALEQAGRRLRLEGTPYAVEPGTVHTKDGGLYRVFTPFYRAWKQVDVAPPGGEVDVSWARGIDREELPEATGTAQTLPAPGEQAAHDRLDAFLAEGVDDYDERRNLVAVDGTSRLSPYVKWGCVHPRQVLDRLGDTKGAESFRSEIAWREFYAEVLWREPESRSRALNEKMRAMPVDTGAEADERFAAWCEGRTGFPVVDAAMRQLVSEGWMHNRMRMVVASFLVKDLHIDWTRGARFFMEHLVDGDLASNQHGWQWVAGTGTDAAPYFRIFNPWSQGEKFDPDGEYVRRWVPELADVAGSGVHEPRERGGGLFAADRGDYPDPIVDHKTEREESLARYQALSS